MTATVESIMAVPALAYRERERKFQRGRAMIWASEPRVVRTYKKYLDSDRAQLRVTLGAIDANSCWLIIRDLCGYLRFARSKSGRALLYPHGPFRRDVVQTLIRAELNRIAFARANPQQIAAE